MNRVKYRNSLEAIRIKKDISSAFRVLEAALVADEEKIEAFMAKHAME